MGENGAGKSTLIKIITGVYRPDAGPRARSTAGRSRFASPREALAAGIGAVHQERNLIPRFSVGENILLERLPTRNGLVDYAAIDREARRYLDHARPRHRHPRRGAARSSVAQMQIVEIAKALSLEAKILLLDEPTASITEHETAALFTLLRRLRDEGVAIVFVSHKLEEVFAIADRVTVLRDGKNAAIGEPMAGMTRQKLVVADDRPRGARSPSSRDAHGSTGASRCSRPRGLATSLGHRDIELRRCVAARSSGSTGWSAPAAASSRRRILGDGRGHRRRAPRSTASRRASRDMHEALQALPHRLYQRGPQAGGADPHAFGPRQRRDHHLAAASPARSA